MQIARDESIPTLQESRIKVGFIARPSLWAVRWPLVLTFQFITSKQRRPCRLAFG